MKSDQNGFTLMELVVVIFVIAILAAITLPVMRGKIDKAKWSEGIAAAGMIRNCAKIYYNETGTKLTGKVNDEKNLNALNLLESDLFGTYFQASDYEIVEVDDNGLAVIRITGNQSNAPTGSILFPDDGTGEIDDNQTDSGGSGSTQAGSSQGGGSQTGGSQAETNQSSEIQPNAPDMDSEDSNDHGRGKNRWRRGR